MRWVATTANLDHIGLQPIGIVLQRGSHRVAGCLLELRGVLTHRRRTATWLGLGLGLGLGVGLGLGLGLGIGLGLGLGLGLGFAVGVRVSRRS